METELHDEAATLCRDLVATPTLSGQEGEAVRDISAAIRPDYVIVGEASELNLKIGQRGRAEIVLETFGRPTVLDRGTYTDPRRHPDGIELVMVNGEIAYASAKVLGEEFLAEKPSGTVIRL